MFIEFYNMILTQFNVKIKTIRSDNAPELAFTEFFKEKGIVSYHSCRDRPQQNAVVERKHQHLLNLARALYFQSNIPLDY